MNRQSSLAGGRDRITRGQRGFTLIELMIVVAVITVLAMIAYPSYMDSVRKSRRADAITALNTIAQQQERWRANNTTYTTDLTAAGLGVANPAHYTLSVNGTSATGYAATATAAGAQTSDAKCASLTLTLAGGNLAYTSTGTATAAQCWNR
jgi:type IV pilus assembly protein PilE